MCLFERQRDSHEPRFIKRDFEFPSEITKSVLGIPLTGSEKRERTRGRNEGEEEESSLSGLSLPKESRLMHIIKSEFTTFVFTHG